MPFSPFGLAKEFIVLYYKIVRRIFIIPGLLILTLFFVSSNVNAVPTVPQNPPGSSTPPIPCDNPNAILCLTTQSCSGAGCQIYNCNERFGLYFCDNPIASCQAGKKCLSAQPCNNDPFCKIYSCFSNEIFGTHVLQCVPPKSGEEIAPDPTEPEQPPLPCAKVDQKGYCIVETGLGINISTDPAGFIKSIFSFILGISGGIALLLIIYSGYKLMATRGEPETLKAARDQLIAAIIGLVFIIFSLVILEVIGVDILKIPGFNP